MNTALTAEENNQPRRAAGHNIKNSGKRAKITGILCIAWAAAAVVSGFFSPNLYFLFLFLAATFSLLGYLEIGAVKNGLMNWTLFLISGFLLVLLFILSIGPVNSRRFLIFYGVFSILIPVILTAFALATRKVAIWQALIPLLIPAFHIITPMTANSELYWLGFLLVPFGWGLLGLAAYAGREEWSARTVQCIAKTGLN